MVIACKSRKAGIYLYHLVLLLASGVVKKLSFYVQAGRKGRAYMQKAGDTCDISPQIFLDFRKILGCEREINTAPKPSPEVPS